MKRFSLIAAGVALLFASSANAGFHFMQIQKVVGGLGDDPTVQAVQLRLRRGGQIFVSTRVLRVYDAAGLNPVELITFPDNVANGAIGDTILAATAQFQQVTGLTADFTLTNPIPQSYFSAGRLTFESGTSVYWAVAWGGAAYTGTHVGQATNDEDSNFGPAFDGPLPSSGNTALTFSGAATDFSTMNALDYTVPAQPAVFTNNGNISASLPDPVVVFIDGFEDLAP